MVEQVPGFGGLFIDSTGVLTAYLTDLTKGPASVGSIREFARSHHTLVRLGGNTLESPSDIHFRHGRFDYRQLVTTLARLQDQHALDRSVSMVDIDESQNHIEIGVSDASHRERLRASLERLAIPIGSVVVTIQPLIDVEQHSGNLQQSYRPLLGGLQIQTDVGICTLGFNALINGTHYFVTNSHCTPSFGDGTNPGYAAAQPLFPNVIGTEWYDPPLFTSAQNSQCPVGRHCRYSDAALFLISPGVTYSLGSFAPTAGANNLNWSTNLDYYWTYHSENNRANGGWVNKTGRTTGSTGGNVSRTCATFAQSENGVDTGRSILCQWQAGYASLPGDSGSPVEWATGFLYYSSNELSGIHWGSGGVFSPITNIHAELGAFQVIACFDPVYGIAPVECP